MPLTVGTRGVAIRSAWHVAEVWEPYGLVLQQCDLVPEFNRCSCYQLSS